MPFCLRKTLKLDELGDVSPNPVSRGEIATRRCLTTGLRLRTDAATMLQTAAKTAYLINKLSIMLLIPSLPGWTSYWQSSLESERNLLSQCQ